MSEIEKPERRSPLCQGKTKHASGSFRERVLKAAFTLFREEGFSSTSMLDIVTRARVSKRDLYALLNNKHAVIAACISECAHQMRRLPGPNDSNAADPGCASVSMAPEVKLLIECAPRNDLGGDESLLKICTASGPDPI